MSRGGNRKEQKIMRFEKKLDILCRWGRGGGRLWSEDAVHRFLFCCRAAAFRCRSAHSGMCRSADASLNVRLQCGHLTRSESTSSSGSCPAASSSGGRSRTDPPAAKCLCTARAARTLRTSASCLRRHASFFFCNFSAARWSSFSLCASQKERYRPPGHIYCRHNGITIGGYRGFWGGL